MDQKNNIVPLFINSRDRINISDSTTNFTIALKKSLRNIAALQVSNVVIPRTDTLIGPNNNTLSGAIIVDGTEVAFDIVITSADYTATTLAAELQTELNDNSTMISFPITWTVAWNSSSKRMEIQATYPDGASHTWAIRFDFTSLIDVIGLGNAGTVAQTFTANPLATALNVPCNRTVNIVRALSYNITSAQLTNSINTSFIKSLGKQFAVDGINDSLVINAKLVVGATMIDVPRPASGIQNPNERHGVGASMSSDGMLLAIGSNGAGAFVFNKLADGSWVQLISGPVRDPTVQDGQGASVAIAGNGLTMAIGATILPMGGSDIGATYIFTRVGSIWTKEARLVGTGYTGFAGQGRSVSMSIAGDRVATGAPVDNSNIGAAWVFRKSGATWIQEAFITPTGGIGTPIQFGTSVSLSGAGDVMAIGGSFDNAGIGAVWMYSRSGTIWSYVTKIVAPDGLAPGPGQGILVALSADGLTLAFGSFLDNGVGATWVYTWDGLTWNYQTKIVAPSTPGFAGRAGGSVALSSNGNTLVIGTPGNASGAGSTSVYTRSGIVWSAEATQLIGTGYVIPASQGGGVAISAAGDDFLTVSGTVFKSFSIGGGGWVFKRTLGIWSQSAGELFGTGGNVVYSFGNVIAISDDGLTLVATNLRNDNATSSAFVYVIQGYLWVQQAELIPNQVATSIRDGLHVSISSNGNTVAIGDPGDNAGAGATWIFTRAAGVWTQQTKINGVAPIVNQGQVVRLSQSGTTVAIAGSNEGVRILNLVGTTWIDIATQLGLGIFGGQPASAIDFSASATTLAISAISGGAAAFIFASGAWSIQGPNFNTFYAPFNPVNTFANAVAISPDGNTIAAGSSAATDGPAGNGAVYVFTRTNGTWSQTAAFTGSGGVSSAFGAAVAIGNNGDMLIVGGPLNGANDNGSTWVFNRSGLVWTEQTRYDGDADFDNFGHAVDIQKTGPNFISGAPTTVNTLGYVREFIAAGTEYKSTIAVTVPSKSYSIFDVYTSLTRLLSDIIATGTGYVVTFDGVSKLTITSSFAPPVISHTFYVDVSSTFDIARWLSTTYLASQVSATIDFSINNDVLKQVTVHSDNSDNVLVDHTTDTTYRKYPAGYTIDVGTPIDIQLRNDRDQIVDLNGANWICTIYATVRA